MAVVSINTLKGYFETGDKPTQQQFENLIDTLAAITSANDIYTSDGTLQADRVVEGDSNTLIFLNLLNLYAQVQNIYAIGSTNGNKYFVFDAVNKKVSIGDYDAEGNSTLFEISDITQKAIVKAVLGFGIKNNAGFSALLKSTNLTADRNIEFQNADGTVAFLSDVATKADLVGGLVPSSQLPSYVDDVLEYANVAAFPATGETGKIYIALSPSSKQYRWTGSAYIQITNGLIGSTSDVPEGSNKYYTDARVLAALLTGYTSGAGTITSADSVLAAIQKLNGNLAALSTSSISEGSNKYYTDARVLAALLTGYTSGAGTITSADSVLAAIQKLNGNLAVKVKDTAEQVFAASLQITTSVSSPSGTTGHYYQWSQTGRVVRCCIYLKWATPGSGMSQILMDLPSDMPLPYNVNGANASANTIMYICTAHGFNTGTGVGNTMWCTILYGNGSNRTQRIAINHGSQGNAVYQIMLQYFTDN